MRVMGVYWVPRLKKYTVKYIRGLFGFFYNINTTVPTKHFKIQNYSLELQTEKHYVRRFYIKIEFRFPCLQRAGRGFQGYYERLSYVPPQRVSSTEFQISHSLQC